MTAEFRIGNTVRGLIKISNGRTVVAHEFFTVDFAVIGFLSGAVPNDTLVFEPIPLTPAILEKLFGNVSGKTWEFDISESEPSFRKLVVSFVTDMVFIREGVVNQPRHQDDVVVLWNKDYDGELHLHQLQNFYWCATAFKKELQIQL